MDGEILYNIDNWVVHIHEKLCLKMSQKFWNTNALNVTKSTKLD